MSCSCGSPLSYVSVNCTKCEKPMCLLCTIKDDHNICEMCNMKENSNVKCCSVCKVKLENKPINCESKECQTLLYLCSEHLNFHNCQICNKPLCDKHNICLGHTKTHCSYCNNEIDRKKMKLIKKCAWTFSEVCSEVCSENIITDCRKTICFKCDYHSTRAWGRKAKWIGYNDKDYCEDHQIICTEIQCGAFIPKIDKFKCKTENCNDYGCPKCLSNNIKEIHCGNHSFYCYHEEQKIYKNYRFPLTWKKTVKYRNGAKYHMCSICFQEGLYRIWLLKTSFRNCNLFIPRDMIEKIIPNPFNQNNF